MKSLLVLCGGCLLSVLLLVVAARAEEVKTGYYTLDLPADWKLPRRVQRRPNGDIVAVLQNMTDGTAVSVAVLPSTASIKDIAARIITPMKIGGFTFSEMKPFGDSWVVEFAKADAKGIHYFTSNGKKTSVLSIIGKTLDTGKAFLQQQLKPVDPKLFPASY